MTDDIKLPELSKEWQFESQGGVALYDQSALQDYARAAVLADRELMKKELGAQLADSERLDWLEKEAKKSYTGISFDYVNFIEEGRVLDRGFRFMKRHFVSDSKETIRKAIDAARSKGED